jgi:hypothetical protein
MKAMSDATLILEWKSEDGSRNGLVLVEDTDMKRDKLEISQFNKSSSNWESKETVDHVSKVLSFGIPEKVTG